AKFKAEYQRIAQTWRTLARGYEFEGSLGRFISFNESRKKALPVIPPAYRETISSAGPAAAPAAELTSRNDAETILCNTPFLVARCNSDLRCVFVNEAYARMRGRRPTRCFVSGRRPGRAEMVARGKRALTPALVGDRRSGSRGTDTQGLWRADR